MRFQPQAMIQNVSGKFGNQITNVMKGSSAGIIQTLKKYTKPFNPNTADQQLTRDTFKYFSNLFYKGETATVEGSTWTQETLISTLQTKARERNYRGIATIGDNAGIQLFLGAAVKLRSTPEITNAVTLNLLPQDSPDAGNIDNLNDAMPLLYAEIDTMTQVKKLGYTD